MDEMMTIGIAKRSYGKVMVVNRGATLSDMVECFEGALKACGFCFDGRFELVEED